MQPGIFPGLLYLEGSMVFRVYAIDWDSEGESLEECKLPNHTMVEVPSNTWVSSLYELVGITLHDQYGFKPLRYKIELCLG